MSFVRTRLVSKRSAGWVWKTATASRRTIPATDSPRKTTFLLASVLPSPAIFAGNINYRCSASSSRSVSGRRN